MPVNSTSAPVADFSDSNTNELPLPEPPDTVCQVGAELAPLDVNT